jgi:hypothetical protein
MRQCNSQVLAAALLFQAGIPTRDYKMPLTSHLYDANPHITCWLVDEVQARTSHKTVLLCLHIHPPTLMSKRSSLTLRTVPLKDTLPCSLTTTLAAADTAVALACTCTAARLEVLHTRANPAWVLQRCICMMFLDVN